MFLIAFAGVVALAAGGFYYWTRRQGLLATGRAAEGEQGTRRISLLTEAVAYVGTILILAGGAAAIAQRWHSIGAWGHVGVFATAAAFFLLIGLLVRGVSEHAVQRLVGVAWLASVAGVAGAVGFAAHEVCGTTAAVTILAVGVGVASYSAVLWLVRRRVLQDLALFAGLVVTICGIIITVDASAPSLAFAVALWGFGLAWAVLGWRRYVEPLPVTVLSGVVLALVAPILAAGAFGWVYAIGIVTAAAVMAASVPLRNTPLLAAGTLAMFVYVSSAVLRYCRQSLGMPAALSITGVLIIGLAVVSARLRRTAHSPKPEEPGTEMPSQATHPPEPLDPGAEEPKHQDLPKAS